MPEPTTDPAALAAVVEDAAHFPGGHAASVVTPGDEAGIAAAVRAAPAVLAIGAQSSLTGGATPFGELVVSTRRLNRILEEGPDFIRVQAGVTVAEIDQALERAGRYYPPGPTFTGAFAGGTVATNAAGAATFKYGTTRDWVQAMTVVLPDGFVLDIRRGDTTAHPDGFFELERAGAIVRVPVPRYAMPRVPKISAGYYAAPGMDLIDLFIGSEGTLGVVVDVTLRVLAARPAACLAFIPFTRREQAIAFAGRVRTAARETRAGGDPAGIDVSAIEHMDARSLALVVEDGADRRCGVSWPAATAMALLVTLELPPATTAARAFEEIGAAREDAAPDTPLVRFCRLLDGEGRLECTAMAVPGDRSRAAQLLALREAVPEAVNRRVGIAKQRDARIEKTAADMIVPFDRVGELLALYERELDRRGLDAAIWGHISDGNLHPNVIPRSLADVESGKEAILLFGREVIRMGGSPLAEHGVGRNPVKQQLLAELYGAAGIDQMRAVKRAIDPDGRMAPGVLFRQSG
ncbi:MAG TPA: FAD-binding oxidoreductase [Vicinamibacterales bacterium]|nr:FAD-binding oxidoreductase [Vicinamibacterales bacterium]